MASLLMDCNGIDDVFRTPEDMLRYQPEMNMSSQKLVIYGFENNAKTNLSNILSI
jgi:hypothetical protein